MPTPPVHPDERARRKAVIETLLREGYHPQGGAGGIASATKEAERREGINYPRWVRDEERFAERGLLHHSVDWSLYVPPTGAGAQVALAAVKAEEEMSVQDHARVRASWLSAEITGLVTGSRYPLVNPDAIVVDSHLTRKYNRRSGAYEFNEGTPRTWLTDTLRVAAVADPRGRKFIFTSAQNDAELHPVWWNLLAYAEDIGADVVVGPLTYETQWWADNDPTAHSYAPELADYLCFGQMQIGPSFIFAGEMNTLPTANAPISDLTTYSRSRWAVFPHQKRQLRSVPSTDPNIQSHQVMTTGSVTRPKVIPRKAGIKSIFHHVAGAVIVEFDADGNVFCRQITADERGTFYDLDAKVEDRTVTRGHAIEALVCGDVHLRKLDPINALATFGFAMGGDKPPQYRRSLIEVLRPKHILLHDIFDNEARNHHHIGDNAYSYEMAIRGRDSVLDEIQDVADFLMILDLNADGRVIVVESNHDIGLDRYVKEGRYRNDGGNIKLGLMLELAVIDAVDRRAASLDYKLPVQPFSLLEHAIRTILRDDENRDTIQNVEWVYDGQSRLIDGIEVGHHGFRGVNGSKGTIAGFARVGRKMTIADKHTGTIEEGVYVAGAMQLQMGYNKGPSTWTVSHVVQYADGSRSLITLQNGRWRAEDKPRIAVQAGSLAA